MLQILELFYEPYIQSFILAELHATTMRKLKKQLQLMFGVQIRQLQLLDLSS